MKTWIWITLLSLLPISELRGSIPYALIKGDIPWGIVYVYCVVINALAAPLAYAFLDTLHKILYKWTFYSHLFDRIVERARRKLAIKVEKWGFWGVALFVGIPLPITGAWTGTLGSWILGMNRRKTMLAVLLGVSVSGIIVSVIVLSGIEVLSVFIKYA